MGLKRFPLMGKYRDIVIAASLFVIFDLFVLVLNFYTSFEIAEDATAINLAGRQRMLSQRMTKALLQIETAREAEQKVIAMSELHSTATLFGDTFNAFKDGGKTRNTDNTDITLLAVSDEEAQAVMKQAEAYWLPLKSNIETLTSNPADSSALAAALLLANSNNLQLLKLMNALTTRLAVMAHDKAERLRLFQTIGITLASINFALLLFHFLRKLNRSDAAAEEARKETEEILTTVNDGFFLVDRDLNLGHKYSSAMSDLFKREIIPGTPFLGLLEGKVNQQTLDTAREYIQLLFTKRIRENLTSDLNPLIRLEIDLSEDAQSQDIHYLNIQFKRVKNDQSISHLLGSVSDITEQVKLEKSLEISEARSREELNMLSQLLQSDPIQMKTYIDDLNRYLLSINDMLESSHNGNDYAHIVNQNLPVIHKFKGDASAMGSDLFSSMCHELELTMKPLQQSTDISAKDLLSVTVQINTMIAKISTIEQIIEKITRLVPAFRQATATRTSEDWQRDFDMLAKTVSDDLQISARVKLDQHNLDNVETDDASKLRDICIQMIRNSLAHGIETPATRTKLDKPEQGNVSIHLNATVDNTELVIRDDGQGLSVDKIREALLKRHEYSQAQLDEMDDKTIIMTIFRGGISTAETLSEHAGQGIGLNVVRQAMNELGGRLTIGTRRGLYTEFRFQFSNVRLNAITEEMAA